ncbi:gamma-glutamyl-gamma-aminobutyrate hydrolase family protein, partial [Acinetobacter baumannii]
GALLDLVRPTAGEHLPADGRAHTGLVVLGGPQSALDDDGHPYYRPLCRLIAEFHADGKPVLGICLGSQLIARALGGGIRTQG